MEKHKIVRPIITFVLLVVCMLQKTYFFHFSIYQSVLLSSIWQSPVTFWDFHLGKIIPCITVACFVFLSKKNYWSIIFSAIIDLWCVANLMYFKAQTQLLSYDVILMVSNLSGFENSLVSLLGWDIFIYPIITVVYTIALILTNRCTPTPCSHWIITVLLLFCTFFLAVQNNISTDVLRKNIPQKIKRMLNGVHILIRNPTIFGRLI